MDLLRKSMRPSHHQALFDVTFDRLCEEMDVTNREERIKLREELEEEAEEYRSY